MKIGLMLGFLIIGVAAVVYARAAGKPLEVVPFVDLQKYLGT